MSLKREATQTAHRSWTHGGFASTQQSQGVFKTLCSGKRLCWEVSRASESHLNGYHASETEILSDVTHNRVAGTLSYVAPRICNDLPCLGADIG
ncbi:unnamed protein product [Brassica napus]|uniref:(rape) hypothetical protein n=1 Tax=Brassica napus TaxID=3708 RepID=A0A816Z1N9_BRANA|nr:unnamed protein product [Brassica napus]